VETLSYQQRIGLVIRHIEQNLDSRPDLDELARIACFSPYHFHRIFSAMVGESVAAYVRRLLLERAAMQLGHSAESVTQIALGAGYDSVDAFTRAFRAHIGMLPSEYRRRRTYRQVVRKPGEDRPLFYHEMPQCHTMEVQIKRFAPRLVAAVRYTGPYEECGPAWDKLCGTLAASGLLSAESVAYGISYDNPDITLPKKCRMDACVSLPPHMTQTSAELHALAQHEEIILRLVGSEQEYAALRVKGSYTLLHPAYRSLFGMWFPQSGREPFNDPGFEIYWNSPHSTPEKELLTEICIPLKSHSS
jgi:AraC family transcriptional regulator